MNIKKMKEAIGSAFEAICQEVVNVADDKAANNCECKMVDGIAHQIMEITHNGVPMRVEIKIAGIV